MPGLAIAIPERLPFWFLAFGFWFLRQASAMPLAQYRAQYFFGHRLVCPYFFA